MSLDPALLEAAIRADDTREVRELLKDASEADRRACARALKSLLKGPGFPDDFMMIIVPGRRAQLTAEQRQELAERHRRHHEQQRAYDEWRAMASRAAFQLARLGLAGGIKVAADIAQDLEGFLSYSRDYVDLAAAVLADWRPPWLAEVIRRHLSRYGEWQLGIPAWPLARALVLTGAIPRPDVPEYTTLLPASLQRWEIDAMGRPVSAPTPAQALIADPGLLDDEVWRLFLVPDAGKALATFDERAPWTPESDAGEITSRWPTQTWAQALAQLSGQGRLDHGRLLDASVDAFARDFNPNRVSWYASMLAELAPSIDEVAARQPQYLGLLGATSTVGVKLAQEAASTLLNAGLLDPRLLLAASPPALLHPQKGIAIAQQKLIARLMASKPETAAEAVPALGAAFGHQRQDVQEAALALIGKHGIPDGAPLAELRLRALDLSPSLVPRAAALGLLEAAPAGEAGRTDELAELERRIAAIPAARAAGLEAALSLARSGEVPGPGLVLPGAGAALPEPVTDPQELVHLLSMLMEDAADAIAAERAIAGAVRLCGLPERERRQAVAPLLKRAARVMNTDEPFKGDRITADLAMITCVWAGERIPPVDDYRDGRSYRPGDFVVDSSGRATTMTGIFTARAWEAARLIEAGRGGLLLAEPQTDRGAISAGCLLDRLGRLAREQRPLAGPHDRDAALLRLAPEVPEALWPSWSEADGTPAESLREARRLIGSTLSFEVVVGAPAEDKHVYRGWDELVLARLSGPVPKVPLCPSWRLLTRLTDPIEDHAELIEAGLYEQHYDDVVASWPLQCPWQPELAAAHLLRPLSAGLNSRTSQAGTAIAALSHRDHPLGPAGHAALIAGLGSAEADTQIAAAQLWAQASADGRLDPALAAGALVACVRGHAVKLKRVADALHHASHSPLSARRIVETTCASAAGLHVAGASNLHVLIELAARLGNTVGVPDVPAAIAELASGPKRGTRLGVTAAQLLQARDVQHPPALLEAAAGALAALADRAEA